MRVKEYYQELIYQEAAKNLVYLNDIELAISKAKDKVREQMQKDHNKDMQKKAKEIEGEIKLFSKYMEGWKV